MEELLARLERSPTIEFTTFGARSGDPSRIEIWAWVVDGRVIITGTPGPRDWLANVTANPDVIVHAGTDHPGRASVVTDVLLRRRVFESEQTSWYLTQTDLDDLVANSPMVEVVFAV